MQGDDAWFQSRLGKATASRFKDVLAKLKNGKPAATRQNYLAQLVVERMTQTVAETYQNTAMAWGTEKEPEARLAYEDQEGVFVDEADFIGHPALLAGASPDGLIEGDGALEIKCPYQTAVHIETLRKGMPPDHMAQVQGVMWIADRQWLDFVSYDPRMPERLRLFKQRIPRDEAFIATLEQEVTEFLSEVAQTVTELETMAAEAA